ncbi:MAG: dihydrodipicolinate synthase family protein [Christensenellales bacterium]
MSRILFTGIMPALVTPVDEDGKLRQEVARRLVRDLGETGITGYYILGGTGEGVTFDAQTRMEFAELVVSCAPKGLNVINHIAAADLSTVKRLAAHSRKIGCHGLSSVPPFFYRYDERGILDYYRAMSDASEGLAMFIYASPLAGAPLPVQTVEKMLDIPGFVGMKYTNTDYYAMSRYKKLAGGDINVINGPDETLLLGLMMGADGGIGSTYNIMPKTYVGIYDAWKRGDVQEALRLQMRANEVIELLLRYDVISAVKHALTLRGYDIGDSNRPRPTMTPDEKQALTDALRAISFPEGY